MAMLIANISMYASMLPQRFILSFLFVNKFCIRSCNYLDDLKQKGSDERYNNITRGIGVKKHEVYFYHNRHYFHLVVPVS